MGSQSKQNIEAVIFTIVLIGLTLMSRYNYLLFHSIIELSGVMVSMVSFVIFWNIKDDIDDNPLFHLSIALFFVAVLDSIHTFTYKGMGVYPEFTANPATQFWIAARGMQAIAYAFILSGYRRPYPMRKIMGIYMASTLVIILGIIVTKTFPVCYIEGTGLTQFKIISEYIISGLFLLSLLFLYKNREDYPTDVLNTLAASIALTIVSELLFTLYTTVTETTIILGHLLKFGSMYLIYKCLVQAVVTNPLEILFTRVKEEEQLKHEAIRKHNETLERYASFMNSATDGFVLLDKDMRFIDANPNWLMVNELSREIIGKNALDYFPKLVESGRYAKYLKVIETGEPVEFKGIPGLTGEVYVDINAFKVGDGLGLATSNVTKQVQYNRKLESLHTFSARLEHINTVQELAEAFIQASDEILEFDRIGYNKVEHGQLKIIATKPKMRITTAQIDGKGITARAARTQQIQHIKDVREDEDYVDVLMEDYDPTLSELAFPLLVGGKTIAVLNVESTKLDAFSDTDIKLFTTLSDHIASTLNRIHYQERLDALYRYGLEIVNAENLKVALDKTWSVIERFYETPVGSIGVVENGGINHIIITGSKGGSWIQSLDSKGITVRAVREAKTQLVNDIRLDPDYFVNPSGNIVESLSELAVPVIVDGTVEAVINVENPNTDAFREEDQKLLETLALHVSQAISRLRQREELEKLVEERTYELTKAIDGLHEANRIKTEFIRTSTHELRTPLTSISGYLEIIDEGLVETDPDKVSNLLDVVRRNTERLITITDDLLDQERIDAHRLKLDLEPTDLGLLLHNVLEEMTPLFEGKNLKLETITLDELPEITIDPMRIYQVFINLLSNAWKFSPRNTTITLTITQQDDMIKVSVMDQGFGIKKEDMEKLFIPFPEMDRPYITEKSTGLGLSITKGIIEHHGGEIWAESEGVNKGATFHFTIPVR